MVFVEFLINKLILSLLLEGDDDEGDEDVDEEEGEDDEVDDVEDGHLHAVARLWSQVLLGGLNRVAQHTGFEVMANKQTKYLFIYLLI